MNIKKISILALMLIFTANPVFAKKDKDQEVKQLPPGLQKKVNRGGELPPGWAKKMEVGKPLDKEVYEHRKIISPVDDKGLLTIEVDGKLVRLYEATREIVKILK
jgi:hypothetical protein